MTILTTLVTGTSAVDALDTHNQMLARTNKMWDLTAEQRPTRIIVDGDSKGVLIGSYGGRSALYHSQMIYPANIIYDDRTDNLAVGTSFSNDNPANANTGMTSAARLLKATTRIKDRVAAGEAVWVIMKIGTNDSTLTNDNGALSTIANLKKYWANAKAAGASGMILFSVDPSARIASGDAHPTSKLQLGASRAMSEWARDNRAEIEYVDNTVALSDPNAPGYSAPNLAGQYGCTMYDQLHESAYGAVLQGRNLAEVMRRRFPPRPQLSGNNFDNFDPATNARGPIFGPRGRLGGTGATSANHDVTGGTFTGADKWPAGKGGIYARLSGTQTLEIRDVPWPEAVRRWKRSDIRATELVFTGTPSADGSAIIGIDLNNPSGFTQTGTKVWPEVLFQMNNLTNQRVPRMNITGSNFGEMSAVGGADIIPVQDGLMRFTTTSPVGFDNPQAIISTQFAMSWFSGQPTEGSIIVYGLNVYVATALPAATA